MLLSEKLDFTKVGANNPRVAKNLLHNGKLTDLGQLLAGLCLAVQNYGGPVTLRTAIAHAPSTPAVRTTEGPYGLGKGQYRRISTTYSNTTALMNNLLKMGYATISDQTTARGADLFDITEEGIDAIQATIDEAPYTIDYGKNGHDDLKIVYPER